jgi:hypothetical protein
MTKAREGVFLISRAVILKEKLFNVRQPATSGSKRRATRSDERKGRQTSSKEVCRNVILLCFPEG